MLQRSLSGEVDSNRANRATRLLTAGGCPLCGYDSQTYLFIRHGIPVSRCNNCSLMRLYPQPSALAIQKIYAEMNGQDPFGENLDLGNSLTEQAAARNYLSRLEAVLAPGSDLLVLALPNHPFTVMAVEHGYKVESVLTARQLEEAKLSEKRYDAAVIIFQLEKASDPVLLLEQVHAALRPGGALLLVTPSLDSWSAQFFRSQWTEWRPESLYYFDRQTIQSALLHSGFAGIEIASDRRNYSLQHLYSRAKAYPRTGLTRLVRLGSRPVPSFLRSRVRLQLPASAITVLARRIEPRSRPLLSIVMPAFNEKATIRQTLEAVLAKELPGIDKELIIVESNSNDGTREVVLSYQGRPGVKIVLEDRPRGKGRAVRTGFEHAEGDFVIIQDADQEYDVNDYDALIEPLKHYQRAFVLGSRHIGGWKMRKFNDQPAVATFYNLGHLLFTGLVNLFYGQKLKDPFTMYKVFRRDCLYGLKFECNRFDFDFELVIKLLRKGYVPVEIPVNYNARSFSEGKKVSTFRDPVTWVRALVKYRFAPIYEKKAVVERKRS